MKVSADWPFVRSVLAQIAITVALATSIRLTVEWEMFWSLITATVVWTLILCWTPMFGLWFIAPKANTAVVLANSFKREPKLRTRVELTQIRPSKAMRVAWGPTINGRLPWEKIFRVVNLLRSIPIKNDKLEAKTQEGIKVTVKWNLFLMAIRADWAILNLVQHSVEKIETTFQALCNGFIQSVINGTPVEVLLKEIDGNKAGNQSVGSRFAVLFGGENRLTKIEAEMGMQTRNPIVSEIVIDPQYLKTLQLEEITKKVVAAHKLYAGTGIDPDIAANMVATDRGVDQPARVTRHVFSGIPEGARVIIGEEGK
jgi:hypothetical protein